MFHFMQRDEIGRNIAAARDQAGLKQAEAAKEINVAVNTLSQWERGMHMPPLDAVLRMLRIYNCTFEDLVGVLAPEARIDLDATCQQLRGAFFLRQGDVDKVLESKSSRELNRRLGGHPFLLGTLIDHRVKIVTAEEAQVLADRVVWPKLRQIKYTKNSAPRICPEDPRASQDTD